MHINNWNNKNYSNFEKFIKKNYKKIVNLDHVINVANPNFLQNLTNYFVEKTLKTARLFR